MLKLYHAPNSRSSSILALIEELDVSDRVDVIEVAVRRQDGSGGPDPRNPHPEGKVPYLVDGSDCLRERGAIVAYLADRFPHSELGRPVGHPQRGAFLSWLFYYQGVMEPALVHSLAKLEHPALQATFRDIEAVFARLTEALEGQPYLLGAEYSAVDLLLSSPFQWMPEVALKHPVVQAWVTRCADRAILKAITEREKALLDA